jgi:hypothetical protein
MRFVGSVCSLKMLVNFCQTIRSLVFFLSVRKCMCVQKKEHRVKTLCSVLTPSVQPFRNSFTVHDCKILKLLICIESDTEIFKLRLHYYCSMANLNIDFEECATSNVNFTECLIMLSSDFIQACTVCLFFACVFQKEHFKVMSSLTDYGIRKCNCHFQFLTHRIALVTLCYF